MGNLKILILNDFSYVEGGASKIAILSALELLKNNNEVVFFSAVGPPDKELSEAPIKRLICLGQKDILHNNRLEAAITGIYNLKALKELKKLFNEWLPDIVHVHNVNKALSWATLNLIYSYKIPIVYTIHDYSLLCPNIGIYNYKKNKVCNYYKSNYMARCLITNCDRRSYMQKLWRWVRYIYLKKILRIPKKIKGYIAVSNFVAGIFAERLPKNALIEVIHNPVQDSNKRTRHKEIKNNNKINFLYVGRLAQEKGVDLLLKAFEKVDANLTIIGDGDLINNCRELSTINRNISVLGWLGDRQIAEEMEKNDFLIVPSRMMETFGLVSIEAASNSLPAIVANQGGLAEFIEDGVNGLYFEAGNMDSLESVIKRIIDNPMIISRMSKASREFFVKNNFDSKTYIDNLESFYKKCLFKTK